MSFRDKVGKGLAGIALAGAVGLSSGCAPHARHLYNTGQINEAQFEQMRAEEERQSLGTLFGILGGAGLRSHGLKTGNLNQAIAGEALTGYGIAKAGQSNTNVYVDNGSNRNNSNNQINYSSPVKVENIPSWEAFTCSGTRDFNNDGEINTSSPYEIVNKNKTHVFVGEEFCSYLKLENCKGKEIKYFAQFNPGEKLVELSGCIVPENTNYRSSIMITTIKSGDKHFYWTLDGVKIGEHKVTAIEIPGK